MALRYGPSFVADVTAPSPGPSPLPGKLLVEILATPGEVTDSGDGTFKLGVNIEVPAYSVDTHKNIFRVHAIAIPEGLELPADPGLLIETATIKNSADVANQFEGLKTIVELAGVGIGKTGIQTVIQEED